MSGLAMGCRDQLAFTHLSGGQGAARKQLERRLKAGIAGVSARLLPIQQSWPNALNPGGLEAEPPAAKRSFLLG